MGYLLASAAISYCVALFFVLRHRKGSLWGTDSEFDGPQKFHSAPVPRLGGVGILAALILSCIYLRLWTPAGDQLAPARTNSVTVQQALALWNSDWATHLAEHFAMHVATLAPDLEGQVSLACELAFSRVSTPEEVREWSAYARKHGLANFCRVLFNADEFIFLN